MHSFFRIASLRIFSSSAQLLPPRSLNVVPFRRRAPWSSSCDSSSDRRLVSTQTSTNNSKMDSLRIYNSLKPGSPDRFKPIRHGEVAWYACGPTVYDLSHLGHARNYVSTDYIRRILQDYFGQKVKFVMNITDIDDKIIIRARRARKLALEKQREYSKDDIYKLGKEAFVSYAKDNLPLLLKNGQLDEHNYTEAKVAYKNVISGGTLASLDEKPSDAEAKIKMHLANTDAAAKGLQNGQVFGDADEVLLPFLDRERSLDLGDQSILTDLTRRMEDEFFHDMDALNVLRPDTLTRVTEYVPQIAEFVEKIVAKGFAYESDGSVYFDIAAFEKAGNQYARLRPDARNDKSLQDEGEGSLSKGSSGKKNSNDFALWKKSKPGEPYWPSPWGEGRPGWHIECSVMASDVLGSQMDIHSGGVDLKFPHHDNELAQSEAYYCQSGKQHEWVNYFIHMGHLSISGSKMSKSLKNFMTIQDALATAYTARNMRIVFMMGRWFDGVEISPSMRQQADGWEKTVSAFFVNVKSWLQEASGITSKMQSLTTKESGLTAELDQATRDMDAALADSFDTPKALRIIADIISKVNVYKSTAGKADADLPAIESIARWVTKLVGIFGLDANAKPPYGGIGWISAGSSLDVESTVKPMLAQVVSDVKALSLSADAPALSDLLLQSPESEYTKLKESGNTSVEQLALPFIRAVAEIRDELRRVVSSLTPEKKKAVLALCDRIRDEDLTNLGVYTDDRPDGQASLIKFVPAAELIAAREEKRAQAEAKARAKEEAKLAREKAEQDKWAKAAMKPEDMYKGNELYSDWDAEGMPIKMKDGSDVPKAQSKKLKKEWEKQKKANAEYVARFGEGGKA